MVRMVKRVKSKVFLGLTALLVMFTSCKKTNNGDDLYNNSAGKKVHIILKSEQLASASKSIGVTSVGNGDFTYNLDDVRILLLDSEGKLTTNPNTGDYNVISTKFNNDGTDDNYSSVVAIPEEIVNVAVVINMPDLEYVDINKNQYCYNSDDDNMEECTNSVPAIGYGTLNTTKPNATGEYEVSIEIESMMARIQIENDLQNTTDGGLGIAQTSQNGDEYYATLYSDLRIEAIYLNRTKKVDNNYYKTVIENPKADIIRDGELDITAAEYHWDGNGDMAIDGEYGDYELVNDATGNYLALGSKWGLFNVPIRDVFDPSFTRNLSHNFATNEAYNNGYAWAVTADNLNGSSWESGINPKLKDSFFQDNVPADNDIDKTDIYKSAGALGYNIFPQGSSKTTAEEAKEVQPHLVVKFSYNAKAKTDGAGNIILDSNGKPQYETDNSSELVNGRYTKNLNIVAFKDVDSNSYPAFSEGNIYTVKLSEVINLILNPNTEVSENNSEDADGNITEINMNVGSWAGAKMTPRITTK